MVCYPVVCDYVAVQDMAVELYGMWLGTLRGMAVGLCEINGLGKLLDMAVKLCWMWLVEPQVYDCGSVWDMGVELCKM
jgi:hypothetical protein